MAVEYGVPLFEELLFVESLEYFRCSSGKPGSQLRVTHQSVQCRFELVEVVCGDDESIDFVADNFAGSTGTIECHDGQAAGERFGDDVAEAFVTGRQDEEFGPSQPMLDVGDPTWQRDLLAEPQFVDELFELLALIAFAEQHEMPVGVPLDESAEDGQQSVESFLRMQSSDSEEDVSSGWVVGWVVGWFGCFWSRTGFWSTCGVGDHVDWFSRSQSSAPFADRVSQHDLSRAVGVGASSQPVPDPTGLVVPGVDAFADDDRVIEFGSGLESDDVHAVDEADDGLRRSELQDVLQGGDTLTVVRDGLEQSAGVSDEVETDASDVLGERVVVGVGRVEGHQCDIMTLLGPAARQVSHVAFGSTLCQRVDHECQAASQLGGVFVGHRGHVAEAPGLRRDLFGVLGCGSRCRGVGRPGCVTLLPRHTMRAANLRELHGIVIRV